MIHRSEVVETAPVWPIVILTVAVVGSAAFLVVGWLGVDHGLLSSRDSDVGAWSGGIGLAALLGAAIGAEREMARKAAGVRTYALISMASAGFTYLGWRAFGGGDPTRIASYLLTPVATLAGVGLIFRTPQSDQVAGMTSAGALFASSLVGMAAGVEDYRIAVGVTALTLVILWPVRRVRSAIRRR